MFNLSHVAAFVAVVDTGSFHAAARQMGISQSTISHSLKRLEDMLDRQLIVRGRDYCVPSTNGAVFLPFARSLLTISERSIERLRTNRIQLGASSNIGIYLLQPHLRRLSDAGFANADITIAPNHEIAEKLSTREIDLAFMEWWDARSGFEARLWRTDELVLIVPPDHPFAERGTVTVEDLLGEPLIGGEKGTGTGSALREAFGDRADSLRIAQTLGSTEAVKRAVRAGLGVSIVLRSAVADEIRYGQLCQVEIAGIALSKRLWVIHSKDVIPGAPEMRALDLIVSQPV